LTVVYHVEGTELANNVHVFKGTTMMVFRSIALNVHIIVLHVRELRSAPNVLEIE
jgi:hypothetical protein